MRIDCPHGYSGKAKIGNSTIVFCDVEIFADVCDHADRCGIDTCEFYDITKEGTRKYIKAASECESSIEKQIEERKRAKRYKAILAC